MSDIDRLAAIIGETHNAVRRPRVSPKTGGKGLQYSLEIAPIVDDSCIGDWPAIPARWDMSSWNECLWG